MMPSSVLRLTSDKELDADTALQVTHRVDVNNQQALCGIYTGRRNNGDISLPSGGQPSLSLTHLNFKGGEVLQKYYKLSVNVGAAAVKAAAIQRVVVSSQKVLSKKGPKIQKPLKSEKQVLEMGVMERKPDPMDKYIIVNGVMNPNENKDNFSVTFWMVICTIFGLIFGFGICIAWAIIDERRPEGIVQEFPHP